MTRTGESAGSKTLRNPYLVLSEGCKVNEFDNHEDAQNMADLWNSAYPPSEGYPEFVVDRACADDDCGYCS